MRNYIKLTGTQTIDDITNKLVIGDIYYIENTDNTFNQYAILPKKKEYVGQPYTEDKGIIVSEYADVFTINYVSLTFTANINTSVKVYFNENSYINNKPDDTIFLIANKEKTTTYYRMNIYVFKFSDRRSIISAKIDGAVFNCLGLFGNCINLTTLDLSNFKTANVISMSGMFYNCRALTSLNLLNFDTSNVTNMMRMFGNCSSLGKLFLKFNTSKVTNMSSMFYGCSNLVIIDISNFNTFNVTTMREMFSGCQNLFSLDLSKWETSRVNDMAYMFNGCKSLYSIGPVDKVSGWKSVPSNFDNMFNNCPATPKPTWYTA